MDYVPRERDYDERRLGQWLRGEARGFSRRDLLKLTAGVGAAVAVGAHADPGVAADTAGPIVKPLPPELFTVFGTNAEMRWSAMRDQGHLVPIDRFFVRNQASRFRRECIESSFRMSEVWRTRRALSGGDRTLTSTLH